MTNSIASKPAENKERERSQRSKLFTSINKKYGNWKHTNGELIQNRSHQDDGRFKEYYIAADKLDEAEAMLTKGMQTY